MNNKLKYFKDEKISNDDSLEALENEFDNLLKNKPIINIKLSDE